MMDTMRVTSDYNCVWKKYYFSFELHNGKCLFNRLSRRHERRHSRTSSGYAAEVIRRVDNLSNNEVKHNSTIKFRICIWGNEGKSCKYENVYAFIECVEQFASDCQRWRDVINQVAMDYCKTKSFVFLMAEIITEVARMCVDIRSAQWLDNGEKWSSQNDEKSIYIEKITCDDFIITISTKHNTERFRDL